MPRPVRFTGRVIRASADRGPQNKEFTREDLLKLIPKLRNTQLMYNHGDDGVIGKRAVGKIESAYLDDENFLVVRGVTDDGSNIGEQIFNRIRTEMLDNTLPMLSIHWKAQTLNRTPNENEKIADPDTKDVKEISLVHQGYYEGANIMEVACSGNKLWWKTDASVYTDAVDPTTPKPPVMNINPEEHSLLFDIVKVTPEDRSKMTPEQLLSYYGKAFGETMKRVATYEQKEKRERESYETTQVKEAEALLSTALQTYPEENRPKAQESFLNIAKNYENREVWSTAIKPMLQQMTEMQRSLAEKQQQQQPPNPRETEMSMAASLTRGSVSAPKRIATNTSPAALMESDLAKELSAYLKGLK
jgi:hypothetical protein